MSNTMIPSPGQINSRRPQADPSISIGDIKVEGNVSGSIVVGNRNVIGDNNVVYEVHDYHGAFINWHPAPPVQPRGIKPMAPRAPFEFVGRETEQITLIGKIPDKRATLLYGHDGLGKTALVRTVANSPDAKAMPDGVFYAEQIYDGNVWSLRDILQRLFDKLFESNPPLKVSDPVAELYLQNTSPLVILDQMGFTPAALEELNTLVPQAAVLLTDRIALFDNSFESIELLPLRPEEAVQLFATKARLDPGSTTPMIAPICELLEYVPLAITLIANAVLQKRLSLTTLDDDLRRIQPPSQDKLQAALERSFGLLYSRLSEPERDMLALTAAGPGDSIDRVWLEEQAGGEEVSNALTSLEMLYTHSPRLSIPDGLKSVVQSYSEDPGVARDKLLRRLLEQLKSHSQDFDFMVDELGNILGLLQWASREQRWSDVITLGRAVDPFLTFTGMWDTWAAVLNQILAAADQLKDLATSGWALHQLGTREIGTGTRNQAIQLLRRALRIRVTQGNFTGAAYTLHNLMLILPPGTKKPDNVNELDEFIKQLYSSGNIIYTPPSWWERLWDNISQAVGKIVDSRSRAWLIPGVLLGAGLLAVVAGFFARPSLSLKTQADPTSYHPVGQVIEYNYIVDNPGLLRLAGPVAVTDDKTQVLCPDLTSIGNHDEFLDWNETINCTGFYKISEEDVKKGLVTDTAQAVATSKKENNIRSRTRTLTIRFQPQYIKFSIEADRKTYQNANETINYTFTAANLGKDALQGLLKISPDNQTLQINCPPVNTASNSSSVLNAGESITCTASYKVTEGDLKKGSITGAASASVGDFNAGRQSITIYREVTPDPQHGEGGPSVLSGPVPSLGKAADPQIYADVNQEIKYSYSVTVEGTGRLAGPITITDDNVKVTCPDVEKVGNQDHWLDPGETLRCDAMYAITPADIDRRAVTNTARANAGDVSSTPQSITIYYKTAPPSLRKSANPTTYEKIDQPIEYTYSVTNRGTAPLPGPVTVSDDQLKVTCPPLTEFGNRDEALDPGEVVTCTANYMTTGADVKNGSITNTAWAMVGKIASNSQTVTIYGSIHPSVLSLAKTAKPDTFQKAGDQIQYTYYIQNAGGTPLKGPVTVDDDKIKVACRSLDTIGNRDGVFDPAEILVCTATYVITEEDMKSGSVTNIATASAEGVSSNRDAATVYAKALVLTMSADRQDYQAARDPINYTYTVTSQSRQPLMGPVTVTDDKVQVTCEDVNTVGNKDNFLDWNETVGCTGQYIVAQADIDQVQASTGRGAVTNIARARAGDIVSNSAKMTVQGPLPEPQVILASTAATNAADTKVYDTVGQTITYSYIITNTGNVTLSMPWTITDDHVQNNTPVNCVTNIQQLAPAQSFPCDNTGMYTIVQSDFNFGNSSVTSNASASGSFLKNPVVSDPVSTTVSCPYPGERWVAYSVESGETLAHILTWYPGYAMVDLQRVNCMGSSEAIGEGQTLYVPKSPPLANLRGVIRDSVGRQLSGITVTLYRGGAVVRSQTTGASGAYSFTGLQPGTYRIFEKVITLSRGETETQDFEIRPVTP